MFDLIPSQSHYRGFLCVRCKVAVWVLGINGSQWKVRERRRKGECSVDWLAPHGLLAVLS